jgi:hypothetical protein
MNKRLYHIAAELSLFGGLFYYASKKNNELRQELYHLEQDIEEISEVLQNTNQSAFSDYNKAYQLQEKTRNEAESLQKIKSNLAHDVQELKTARELHEAEKQQVEEQLSEHIRTIQNTKLELERTAQQQNATNQTQTIRTQQLEQREKTLQQQEKEIQQRERNLIVREKQLEVQRLHFERTQIESPVRIKEESRVLQDNSTDESPKRSNEELQAQYVKQASQAMARQYPHKDVTAVLHMAATAASHSKPSSMVIEEVKDEPYEFDHEEIDDEVDRELAQLEEMESISKERARQASRTPSHSRPKSKSSRSTKSKSRR